MTTWKIEGEDELRGIFMLEMTAEEYGKLARQQIRNGEKIEDTLMRLAGLRTLPFRHTPTVPDMCRAHDDSVALCRETERLMHIEAEKKRAQKP